MSFKLWATYTDDGGSVSTVSERTAETLSGARATLAAMLREESLDSVHEPFVVEAAIRSAWAWDGKGTFSCRLQAWNLVPNRTLRVWGKVG